MAKKPERATPALRLVVQYAADEPEVPGRTRFRRWTRAALAQDAEITLRLVDAPEGRALNRRYRRKDYPTNVLTFAYACPELGRRACPDPSIPQDGRRDGPLLSGDIVLCAPLISQEARAQGIPAEAHYAHLTVHGVLHLQGYDHERKRDAAVMEARETEILAKLGYADPYGRET